MADNMMEWWKHPALAPVFGQIKPTQPTPIGNGSVYTGAGPDGIVQPDRPTMAIGNTMVHEDEILQPNGNVIPSPQTTQEDLMRLEQGGGYAGKKCGGYIGMQAGGNSSDVKRNLTITTEAYKRPEAKRGPQSVAQTRANSLGNIGNVESDRQVQIDPITPIKTPGLDQIQELQPQPAAREVKLDAITPIKAPGAQPVTTTPTPQVKPVEPQVTPIQKMQGVMTLDDPYYRNYLNKITQDMGAAETAGAAAQAQLMAGQGAGAPAIGGAMTTRSRDAASQVSKFMGETATAAQTAAMQAAQVVQGMEDENFSSVLDMAAEDVPYEDERVQRMLDTNGDGVADISKEGYAQMRNKENFNYYNQTKDVAGNEFLSSVTKLRDSGQIADMWDAENATFSEGVDLGPDTEIGSALAGYWTTGSPVGMRGTEFDPDNKLHRDWAETQIQASTIGQTDAYINRLDTEPWFLEMDEKDQTDLREAVRLIGVAGATNFMTPIRDKETNKVIGFEDESGTLRWGTDEDGKTVGEVMTAEEEESQLKTYDIDAQGAWTDLADKVIAGGPDKYSAYSSVLDARAEQLQQPEYASKILDLKPDDVLYKKLIQALKTEDSGHVGKPSHTWDGDRLSESLGRSVFKELASREVVAVGNSLYKPVSPNDVPEEMYNSSDYNTDGVQGKVPETISTIWGDKIVDLNFQGRTLVYLEDIHNPGEYITIYGKRD